MHLNIKVLESSYQDEVEIGYCEGKSGGRSNFWLSGIKDSDKIQNIFSFTLDLVESVIMDLQMSQSELQEMCSEFTIIDDLITKSRNREGIGMLK